MATLLILEDEPQLASFLTRGLNAEGHQCHHAATLTDMAEKLKSVSPDLAIIDRMIGADDSLYSLPTWRKRHPDLLFLMLTALGDTEERIEGLRHGADDYLAKPFDFDELLARIDALLRRRPSSQSQTDKVQYHQLTLEPAKQRVCLQAQELQLTTLEFLLLKFFIERPETVLSRERILSQVWSTQN
ncbi:MAG: response regulator transcription factor, partial [Pseudomonadota bacterium]|nr:response regulator transcription factor [Pseudomonadota bacterium]